MAKKELPDFLGKHCKDVEALLTKALNRLRLSSRKNDVMYQEFLACQKYKVINSEISREVAGNETNIDLQVMGYRYENDRYNPAYLLRLCVIKFSGTTIYNSAISPAENE